SGLVASVNRPGGNATGVNLFTQAVESKKLELITKLISTATTVAFLTNPNNPTASASKVEEMQEAARSVGRTLAVVQAGTAADLTAAFATLVQQRIGLLVVGADPFFDENGRDQIITLAAAHQVAAIYSFREATAAGALMSYGTSLADAERQRGLYTA